MYLGKWHAICALVSKVSDLIRAVFVFETTSFFFSQQGICINYTLFRVVLTSPPMKDSAAALPAHLEFLL